MHTGLTNAAAESCYMKPQSWLDAGFMWTLRSSPLYFNSSPKGNLKAVSVLHTLKKKQVTLLLRGPLI